MLFSKRDIPIPDHSQLGFRNYLHALEAPLFLMLFDHCAELQHDILRKHRKINYAVDPCYVCLKGQLEDYAWPMHSPGTGDKKKGAASEPGADGGADLVSHWAL